MKEQKSAKRIRFKPMDFMESEIAEVAEKGRMLVLKAETSAICQMNCLYCYRKNDKGGGDRKEELSIRERIDLIREAAAMGAKAYHIVGAGEPLIDPHFLAQLKEARRLGMEIMVPTDGISLDLEEFLDLLDMAGASILLKLNSFRENIEKRLTQREGYAEIRNRVLRKILERKSFNRMETSLTGAITTRLAISGMITNLNLEEILGILNFCRENNISPFITTFLNVGRTAEEIGLSPTKEQWEELFVRAKEKDLKLGIDDGNGSIYLGGQECNQRGLGLYVNIVGEVRNCVGEKEPIGNIRDIPLKRMWDSIRKQNEAYISSGRLTCPPREARWGKLRLVK